jgi:hypothetical protein
MTSKSFMGPTGGLGASLVIWAEVTGAHNRAVVPQPLREPPAKISRAASRPEFSVYIHTYIHTLPSVLLLPTHPAHRTQPTPLADEPCRTAQCAPHPAPPVLSSPRILWSSRRAGVPPRTPPSLVCVHTWKYLMCPAIGGGYQSCFQSQAKTTAKGMITEKPTNRPYHGSLRPNLGRA